jgi:GDP-4-dehydro-6-deoxy-D-mannose reductase
MRVLVTGASGFVGRHLAKNLQEHGHDIVLTAPDVESLTINGKTHSVHRCDITSQDEVNRMVRALKPDATVHLAGVAHVPSANSNQENLVRINIVGTTNICSALNTLPNASVLLASSALVYNLNQNHQVRLSEEYSTAPNSPYGYSKLAAENICLTYASDRFKVFIARPFNHTGPGQSTEFVCPGLAQRIARCENGDTIEVGNLSAQRDFTDVRDIVDGYRLIIEKGRNRDVFVLGSGKAVAISDVLNDLIKISGKSIKTKISSGLLRSDDPPVVLADPTKIEKNIGWRRNYSLSSTLSDLYNSFL